MVDAPQTAIAWSVDPARPAIIAFEVLGHPKPKGSMAARAFTTKSGKVAATVFETRARGRAWRKAVAAAAAAAWGKRAPVLGPVLLEVTFVFERPAAHHVAGDRARPLKAGVPRYATSAPCGDLSKLVRCVEDEITRAGVWGDDRQVVGYGASTKMWGEMSRAVFRVLEAP